jgi:hypothetical protein
MQALSGPRRQFSETALWLGAYSSRSQFQEAR